MAIEEGGEDQCLGLVCSIQTAYYLIKAEFYYLYKKFFT